MGLPQLPYLISATKLDYVVNGWAPQVGASQLQSLPWLATLEAQCSPTRWREEGMVGWVVNSSPSISSVVKPVTGYYPRK